MIPFLHAPVLTILFKEKPDFSLIRTERGRRLPGGSPLRRRCVDDRSARELPPGTEEVVAATLDEYGTILEEFAWPAQAVVFSDCARGRELTGSPAKRRRSSRRIAFPVRNRARYVLLYRAAIDGGIKRKVLAVLWLRRRPGQETPKSVPAPAEFGNLPAPIEVPFALRKLRFRPLREVHTFDEKDPGWRGGVESVTSLDRKDLENNFDIVIMGEGFTKDQLGEFQKQAKILSDGFLTTEPFASVAELINVHTVATFSRDAGISNWPRGAPNKRTMFGFVNDFEDTDTDGDYGTHEPERIQEAVTATVGRWSEIDLVVVIVNCEYGQGHAYPDLRFIAVARDPKITDGDFVDLAVHEAGHVVADLCDEYVSGIAWSPTEVYANLATQKDVDEGKVSWWSLTDDSERDGPGRFKLVFSYGQAVDDDGYREPRLPPEQFKMLGAFWGCQFADPPRENPTTATMYHDPRGKAFYRPMARCRMRRLDGSEFCRPCAEAIRQSVLSVTRRRSSRSGSRRRGAPPASVKQTPLAARPPGIP